MKKAVSLFLILALLCTLLGGLSLSARAVDVSGTIGNLRWRIEGDLLTISGTGEMPSFTYASEWTGFGEYVTRLVIEPGITSITDRAFESFYKLAEVSLPDTLRTIGSNAFKNDRKVIQIDIPEGVESLGPYCFQNATGLKEIKLPSTLHSISIYAFSGCTALTDIQLPETLTALGGYAFENCESLRRITIPDGITELENYMFYGCKDLQEVVLPATMKKIGNVAFYDCWGLEKVVFPEGLETIGVRTFARTSKLKSVDLPASVREIGEAAFTSNKEMRITIRNPECVIAPVTGEVEKTLGHYPTVIGYYGSTAHDYAIKYQTNFEALDGCALGFHAFTKAEVVTRPTCQTEGERRLTCEFCGETKSEAIPRAEHSDALAQVLQAPTFFSEGRCVLVCTVCGRTREDTLKKLNPGYAYQEVLYDREDWSGAYAIGGYTFDYYYDGSYKLSGLKLLTPRLDTGGPYIVTERANIYGVQTNTAEHAFIFDKQSDGSYTIRSYWSGQYLTRNGTVLGREDAFSQNAKWNVYVDNEGYFVIASTSAPAYQLLYNELEGGFQLLDTYTYEGTTYQAEDIFGVWLYEPDPCAGFLDVDPTAWYHAGIDFVVANELFNGVGNNRFGVDSTMTRAMFVTVLWRMEGEPEAYAGKRFSDVREDTWYTDAVAWASSEGIVNGTSETTFSPDAGITREQMAVLMYRYAQWLQLPTDATGSLAGFPDAARVSGYATEALAWATKLGLVTGTTSGNTVILKPQGSATRAQVATILMRFILAYL